MSIGILFESQEWSSTALCDYVKKEGIEAHLIDLEQDFDVESLLSHKLIVNRVFASAQFRNHTKSLRTVTDVLDRLKKNHVPMINSYEAHFFEISKLLSAQTLEKVGLPSPQIYDCFDQKRQPRYENILYPCILKPNCGGRTTHTHIIHSVEDLQNTLNSIDIDIEFIVQRFIHPIKGYITRIEVIGGACYSILKRSVVANGLSAYQFGSEYRNYDDCAEEIQRAALSTMKHFNIDMGSLDIIEGSDGFYIIDVNSVSNFAEENIEMFGFNLIEDMAKYIAKRYTQL